MTQEQAKEILASIKPIAMKIEDLFHILHENGFMLDHGADEIYYCGELVGDFAGDCVWLCDFQPSLIGMTYQQVHKTIINVNNIEAERRLREQILNFLDTPRRYEEHCRREKLSSIRNYFKDRKDAYTILNQPSFDYTQLIK